MVDVIRVRRPHQLFRIAFWIYSIIMTALTIDVQWMIANIQCHFILNGIYHDTLFRLRCPLIAGKYVGGQCWWIIMGMGNENEIITWVDFEEKKPRDYDWSELQFANRSWYDVNSKEKTKLKITVMINNKRRKSFSSEFFTNLNFGNDIHHLVTKRLAIF